MDLRIVGVQGRASRLGVHAGRISNCHLGQFPFRGQTGSQTARSPVMTYLQIRVRDALSCPWRIPMKPLLFALCVMSDRKSTPELQSPCNLVCRLLLDKKRKRAEERLNRAYQELSEGEVALKETLQDVQTAHDQVKAAQLRLFQAAMLYSVGRRAAGLAHFAKTPL